MSRILLTLLLTALLLVASPIIAQTPPKQATPAPQPKLSEVQAKDLLIAYQDALLKQVRVTAVQQEYGTAVKDFEVLADKTLKEIHAFDKFTISVDVAKKMVTLVPKPPIKADVGTDKKQ